jgi:hypothetical protein
LYRWGAKFKALIINVLMPLRINTALAFAIRLAKNPIKGGNGPTKDYKRIDNENRPDEAYVTERAVRAGRANASSGRIMVTTPNDHFGPIGPEYDPTRNQVINNVCGKGLHSVEDWINISISLEFTASIFLDVGMLSDLCFTQLC